MKIPLRNIIFLGLVWMVLSARAEEQTIDRKPYLESIYQAVKTIVPTLKESKYFHDPNLLEFLRRTGLVLKNYDPKLYFVNDPKQFIINPGEAPRLMRTPEDPRVPIFVNATLLNSNDFQLTLPQIIKLMLHELGHKTQMADVKQRDLWAQAVEALLNKNYQVAVENKTKIELMALTPELIQEPIKANMVLIQPGAWLYRHEQNQIQDLSQLLVDTINRDIILTRSLATEVQMINSVMANVMGQLVTIMKAKAEENIIEVTRQMGFKDPFDLDQNKFTIPDNLQSLVLAEFYRITPSGGAILLDGSLVQTRSHSKYFKFNANGFPYKEVEKIPIQVKMGEKNQMILTPEIEFDSMAKVIKVQRQNQNVRVVEVELNYRELPFSVDLVAQYNGGSFRIRETSRTEIKKNIYRIKFDIPESVDGQLQIADRFFINSTVTQFLNRRIDMADTVSSQHSSELTNEEVLPDSIGLWGVRKNTWVLEKSFSYLNSPFLFVMASPESNQFMINPLNVVVEFEVKNEINIETAELIWRQELMIFNTEKSEHPVINVTDNGIEQRFAAAGTILERKAITSNILFSRDDKLRVAFEEAPSKPGYKKVRVKTVMPFSYLRELKNKFEAHMLPSVIPLSIRLVTNDFRSYMHVFQSDMPAEVFEGELKEGCNSILKAFGNFGSKAAR